MENSDFKTILNSCNLKLKEKESILQIVSSIKNPKEVAYADRLILVEGLPGVGKTFLAEKIVKELDLPILFLGAYPLSGKKVIRAESLLDLINKLKDNKKCAVFIDDLNNLISQDEVGEIDSEDKKYLFKIIEEIKTDEEKVLLITKNQDLDLDNSWIDRFDIIWEMRLPHDDTKFDYLKSKYGNLLKKSHIKTLIRSSYGYNYRDLDTLIKTIYKKSKTPNISHVKEALSEYTPGYLSQFRISRNLPADFKLVIGHEKIKKELLLIKEYLKKQDFLKKSGVKRKNIILFSGAHGTGKTLMVQALSTELGLPIIELEPKRLGGDNPLQVINSLGSIIKKFKNYIVVIDEAEKLIGKMSIFEEDGLMAGAIAKMLDGIQSNTEAIVVFIANNRQRIGEAINDRVQHFEFGLPCEEDRKKFLEIKTLKAEIKIDEDLQYEFVRKTEKFNYRKMESFWDNFMFKLIKEKDVKIKRNKLYADSESIKNSMVEALDTISYKTNTTGIG